MSKKIESLVTNGHALKAQIKDLTAELKEIEAQLLEAGGGEDPEGRKALVIESKPTVGTPEDITQAQAIAGDCFGKLFEKTIVYKPVKSFADVAKALLPKAKAAKLVALCEVIKKPYLKWA